MVGKKILFLFLVLSSSLVFSQQRYAISFTDKDNTTFSVNKPHEFLSQKAIDRRAKHGIEIVLEDVPVNEHYVSEVTNLGATFINKSTCVQVIQIPSSSARIS